MAEAYFGEIRMFAGDYAPEGWLLCNGQLLQIQQYQALFAVIGLRYGGDGRTTFGLPDLRGRVPVGMGQGQGLMSYPLGQSGGAERNTPAAVQLQAPDTAPTRPVAVASSAAGDNRQPYQVVNFIICAQGLWPARP
ncbi:MAG: tail fiber protein [Anaerolineae bacterium]|nr:tail fiber protein [Anaerolineae bacterium]